MNSCVFMYVLVTLIVCVRVMDCVCHGLCAYVYINSSFSTYACARNLVRACDGVYLCASLCLHEYVLVCACELVRASALMPASMCAFMSVHLCERVHAYPYVCVSECMFARVSMCVSARTCLYMCLRMCMKACPHQKLIPFYSVLISFSDFLSNLNDSSLF